MRTTEMPVSITPALPSERLLISGMAQFYIYDFSEMAPEAEDGFGISEAGQFGDIPYFDDYWTEADRHVLLIRWQGEPAGFALLNTHSHLGGVVEHNMGEFFVLRRYRRRGVARAAVAEVLRQFPGTWEVAVAHYNYGAMNFWPKAIAAAPNVSGLVRHQGDGTQWRGPVWRFVAAAPDL
mgnify:CR=1 FL=1|tara:strand:- start:43184 stop:43723 length:540 start_codon:yes stop_codon:yes gene_type:complete